MGNANYGSVAIVGIVRTWFSESWRGWATRLVIGVFGEELVCLRYKGRWLSNLGYSGKFWRNLFKGLTHYVVFSVIFFRLFRIFAGTFVSTGSASLKYVLLSSLVWSRKSAFAALCLMLAWCRTSNSNSYKRSCNCPSVSDASGRFKIQLKPSWSCRILNQAPSRYGLSRSSA